MTHFADNLERLKARHAYRALRLAKGRDFTSNDYLGLSRHPALREAVRKALDDSGVVGAGGSRLLRGHHALHAALEEKAAVFFGCEKSLYFGSGFLANFALFSTLCSRHDAIIFDDHVHASIKEGMHASSAKRYRVRHNDVADFADALERARGAERIWIAVESLYSMGGDFAPLEALSALARQYGAAMIVDEAHATGLFGATGRGLSEDLRDAPAIVVHTCGKALGVSGALVGGNAATIDYLINRARPFIYSTAPPPLLAAAVSCALDLIDREPERRKRLGFLSAFAQERLAARFPGRDFGRSQIIPFILGEDAHAVTVSAALMDAGFDVRAIRPPTVPPGTARLRLSINADHSEDEIVALVNHLATILTDQPTKMGGIS